MPSSPEYSKSWRAVNPELASAQRKRYYLKHRDEILHKAKVYRAANKTMIRAMQKATYLKRRDAACAYGRNRRKELKSKVIVKYGGKCTCSGCTQKRPEFLTVDHPSNDGKQDRSTLHGSISLYRRLVATKPTSKYRLMCYNCNCGRSANGGTCPYENQRH